jgi:putative transcriptional regulator
MSVRHEVPDELLLDYAVGGVNPGKDLLVGTHLAMCASSRARFDMLQEVGGALLDSLEDVPLAGASADTVLARAARAPETHHAPRRAPSARDGDPICLCGTVLPQPLAPMARQALERGAWRSLGFGVRALRLPCSTPRGRTHLLQARPGVRIAPHTHVGEELVLVLTGAFVDEGQVFGQGDLAVNDDSRVHGPTIEDAGPCLCLVVTEGPIRFTGKAGWLLNQFARL